MLEVARVARNRVPGEAVVAAGEDAHAPLLERAHGFDGGLDGALRSEQDEGNVGELVFQSAQQIVSAHARHDEVAHDDRRPKAGDLAERILAIRGFVGLKPPVLDELSQPRACRVIVFDDQHPLTRGV